MLLEHCSSGHGAAGLASLTAGDYRYALSPLAGFMGVGLIASLLLRETLGCASEPDAVRGHDGIG